MRVVSTAPADHIDRDEHNERDGVSNHRRLDSVRKENISDLCKWNSPVTSEFPHKNPVGRNMVPHDDVIMSYSIAVGDRTSRHTMGYLQSIMSIVIADNVLLSNTHQAINKHPTSESYRAKYNAFCYHISYFRELAKSKIHCFLCLWSGLPLLKQKRSVFFQT